jgi:glutaredoxin
MFVSKIITRPGSILALFCLLLCFNQVIFAAAKTADIATPISNTPLSFFYSSNCPHCQSVRDFIKVNKLTDLFVIQEKEISKTENQTELLQAVKKCSIKGKAVELPVLWDGKQCVVGEDAITDYFTKMSQDNAAP